MHVFQTFLHRNTERDRKLAQLSRQELQILSFVSQGMSNKEISLRLHISQKTVKNHLTHVLAKLGVSNRKQATLSFLSNS